MPRGCRLIVLFEIAVIIIALMTLGSCASFKGLKPSDTAVFSPDLSPTEYAAEIHRQEMVLQDQADRSRHGQAYFNLALLYISYKNPMRDYRKALDYLTALSLEDPAAGNQYGVKNLRVILEAVQSLEEKAASDKVESRSLRRDLDRFNDRLHKTRSENEKCVSDNLRLIRENVDLKMDLEKLKTIDLEIEKKKKMYR